MVPPMRVRVAGAATGYLAGLSAASLTAVCLIGVLLSAGTLPSEQLSKTTAETAISALSLAIVIGVVIVGWWLVEFRPRVAVGLCCIGLACYLPELASWTDLPAPARAALLATPPLAISGAAVAATGWVSPTTRVRVGVLVATGLSAAATTVHALGYDPFSDPSCWQVCDPVTPVITAFGLREILRLFALLTLLAALAGVIAIESIRSTPLSVCAAGVLAMILMAIAAAIPWLRWGSTGQTTIDDILQNVAVASVTVAVFVALARMWRVRRGLASMLDHLGDAAMNPPGGLVRAVHFAVPGEHRWIDHEGKPAPDPVDPSVVLGADVDTAIRLVLTSRRDRDEIAAAITPASRIAFENGRLDALNRARLADVQASQRRIVTASDIERRRVERDLHDGAQQRLVSVAMHLRLALSRADAAQVEPLTTADRHLRRALEALRTLSHGAFPAELAEEGLPAAIEDLAAEAPLPVALHVRPLDRRLPDQVEMTAYLSIAAALRDLAEQKGATHMSITMTAERGAVRLSVAGDGHGEIHGLTEVSDRIGAAGGRLDVTCTADAGTVVTVAIPCES